MARNDVVEIQELALNGGMNVSLPDHLVASGTLVDLAEAGIIQNGAVRLTFNPETAAFIGAFRNDLVIITNDDEIIVMKDFIPAVTDGLLGHVILLDGSVMEAPDFLEEYGMSDDLAESLSDIETAAGETVSPNSVTSRSITERSDNDALDGGNVRTASGALGDGGRTDDRSDIDRFGNDGRSRGRPDDQDESGTGTGSGGASGGTVPDTTASTPELTVGNSATGLEDTAIPLTIHANLTDLDGLETLMITISGLPDGAILNAGFHDDVSDAWILSETDLAGLALIPVANASGTITLTVRAIAIESNGGARSIVTDTIDVDIHPDADIPILTLSAASGLEDSAIALDISAALTDDSETLTVEISGIPEGAVLMAGGEAVTVTDGTATLTPDQLADLTVTPPANSSDDFTLTVTAITVDGDSTASTSVDLPVSVTGVADAATVSTAAAAGDEDTAIALDIQVGDVQPGDTASITVTGLPDGAVLSAGTVNDDGSVTLTPEQLAGLTVTPPANSSEDFTLGITVTTTDSQSGDTATVTDTLTVSVAGVADEAELSVAAASGLEDSAIALDISAALTDDSETLTVEISGIPEGAVLMAGGEAVTVTDGTATLTPDQLADLTITPPANSSDDFTLTVTAITVDGDSTAEVVGVIDVSVTGVADSPELSVAAASGDEDTAIQLDISAALTDESETLAVEISGIPEGAVLMAGDTVIDITDGTAQLTPDQLADLTITPPANSSDDFTLTVTAISTDGDSTATTVGTIPITVAAVADSPELSVAAASGDEDTEISLDISAALTDDSETLTVEISGIPNGAILTASGVAIAVIGGFATLNAGQLDALSITPPANSSDDFTLTVTAISTDGDSTATTVGTIPVTVSGVADTPSLETQAASGIEDQPIALAIQASTPDASETLSIEISGIPAGAVLMSGETVISVTDGVAILSPEQLVGLTITPPPHSDVDFELTVTVTSTDGDSTASESGTLAVSIDPEADTPTLTLSPTVTAGVESVTVPLILPEGIAGAMTDATAPYELPAGSGLNGQIFDTNHSLSSLNAVDNLIAAGNTSVTFTATNVDYSGGSNIGGFLGSDAASATGTTGAAADTFAVKIVGYIKIEAGTHNFNVTTDDGFRLKIGGQTITEFDGDRPAGTSTGTFTAMDDGLYPIEIVYWENSGQQVLFVEMDGETIGGDILFANVPDGLTLNENGYYSIPDTVETSTELTISDLPEGAVLSAGVQNPDGPWTVTAEEAEGITVTFPDGGIHAITATVTNSNGTVVTTQTIAAGQDPVVTATLDIQAALVDLDGSETLSISIMGLPAGAVLSAGSIQVDGSVLLTAEELDGLTVTMPVGTDDFDLTVTATSTDGADTASISQTISVDVPEFQGETITGTTGDGVVVGTAGDDVIYGSSTAAGGSGGTVETPVNAIFHFELEDTTWGSNETVTDSVNGVTGTARGHTGTASGANGKAAQFDGDGDYIEVPHSEAMELTSGTFSLNFVAWNNGTLASKDSSGYDDGGHFDLKINSSREVELRVQTDSESFTLSGGNIDWSNWHSASVTWDGETVTLYVNGQAVDSVSTDWNLSANENPWTFGASQINSGDNVANNLHTYLDGKIDNPTLLDAPLTAGQIADLHTNGIPGSLADGFTISEPAPESPDANGTGETIFGGAGDDTIYAGAGNDVIHGGSGNDTIDLTANQATVQTGISPISYWKLEETRGTGVADSIGDNHGTTSGGTVLNFAGNFGSGADLDGSNDRIDIPHSNSMELPNGSLTFSFNGSKQQNTLVSKGEGGGDPGEFDISTRNNGRIRFNFTDEHGNNVRLEGGSIDWDNWNTVTVTWGEDGLQLWLNGSMVASNSEVTNGLEQNDETLKFGADEDNDDEFDGALDDIALFNSQLSSEDIGSIASTGVQDLIDESVSQGSAGGNIVDAGTGDDTVIAGAGADTIDGGDGVDTIDYSNSDAAVMIDFENGVVSGGYAEGDQLSNFENIIGSSFDDTLRGDDGNNRIDGGAGNDILYGGGGADVFVLGSPGDGIDTIVDFNLAEGDRLDISSVVNMNDIDDIANYVKLEDDGSGNTTVMVNTSGDGAAENFSAVASLEGVTGLDVGSILQDHNPGGENV